MKSLLPVNFNEVSCCVVNDEVDLKSLDKDEIDITVCTCSGEVIEFSNKKIINSFQTELLKAISINIFYAYKPFMKYYIIQDESKLLVIEKNNGLKELKQITNVSKFEVNDFLGFGFPQLKVWFYDEMETLITDFSNCWSANDRVDRMPHPRLNLTRTLDTKLQMMNMRLDEARKLYDEKRRCRTRALQFLSSETTWYPHKDMKGSSNDDLDAMTTRNKDSNEILQLETLWQRTFEECWLICLPVVNVSSLQKAAENVHLHLISDDGEFKYRTMIITSKSWGEDVFEVHKANRVPPRSKSVIIGVIDIPRFTMKNSFTVTGMLSYDYTVPDSPDDYLMPDPNEQSCNTVFYYQNNLPCLTLSTNDLVKGDLIPFLGSEISDQDLVAAMAVFEETKLEVILHEKDISIEDIIDKLHYAKVSISNGLTCFVNNPLGIGALSKSILFWKPASENQYKLTCYTRDEKQLLVLVHSLLSLLPHKSQVLNKPRPAEPCLDTAIQLLGSEISFLTESFRKKILPSKGPLPDVCDLNFDTHGWYEMKDNLSAYELKTDLALLRLEPSLK